MHAAGQVGTTGCLHVESELTDALSRTHNNLNTSGQDFSYVLYTCMLCTVSDISGTVCRFLTCCLLTPLMSPKDQKMYEFTELNFLSVGSQLAPRTFNIY